MSADNACAICSGNTIGLSPTLQIDSTSKFSWESDSTMRLLNWKEAAIRLRFCPGCFHSALFPKFDAARLYGAAGFEARKEAYEAHFPGKIYGERERKLDFAPDLRKMGRDFSRFHQTTSFAAELVQTSFAGMEEIRILDWGGGDGYVGAVYSKMLQMITGLPVGHFVYDYTDWEDADSNKVGLENLRDMGEFHVVLLSHILEHTHDPVIVVKAALDFLRPGGLLICEVPNETHKIIQALSRAKFGLNYHVAHFSSRSLYRTLEQAGLNNIHTTYQYDSSYRGDKMSAIAGVAQKSAVALVRGSKPTVLKEVFSLILFTVKKTLAKLLSLDKQ